MRNSHPTKRRGTPTRRRRASWLTAFVALVLALAGLSAQTAMAADGPFNIDGTVPDMLQPSPGCRFAPRCPFRVARCAEQPPLSAVAPGHASACWRAPLDSVLEKAA